jgi:hypothetical protein
MLDFLIPGHHGSSTVDVLIQVATMAAGLLIAAGLRYGLEALRRKRRAAQVEGQRAADRVEDQVGAK